MKEKRIEDKELLKSVRQMPCSACLKTGPSDPHHIKTVKSGGHDQPWNVVSLDREHHQELHKIGLNRFVIRYPMFKQIIMLKGWVYDDYRGKWTHENS